MRLPNIQWPPALLARVLVNILLAFAACVQIAGAVSPGLVVTVRDADSKLPLEEANVSVIGPSLESGSTDASGNKTFVDLADGIYFVRVDLRGYGSHQTARFDVSSRASTTITVELSRLAVIGRVTTRPTSRIDTRTIDQDSLERKLSSDTISALANVPGVGIDQTNGNLSMTLNNEALGASGVTINGLHIGGGSSQAAASVLRALFTGASVSFAPTAYSPAGNVDFRTIQPTSTFQYVAELSAGSFSQTSYSLGFTGPAGRIGYAVQHVRNGADDYLTGMRYLDESGLTYDHDGGTSNTADLLKLRYEVSPVTTASITYLSGTRDNTLSCNSDVTIVPCGDGPGVSRHLAATSTDLSVTTLLSHVAVALDLAHSSNQSRQDELARLVAGVASPVATDLRYADDLLTLTLTSSQGRLSHHATLSIDDNALRFAQFGQLPTAIAQSQRMVLGDVEETYRAGAKVDVKPTLSFKRSSLSGTAYGAGLSVADQVAPRTRLQAQVSGIAGVPALTLTRPPLSDAASAQYDCADNLTTVLGGSDPSTKSSLLSFSASMQHNWKNGTVTANAYLKTERGAGLFAYVPLSAVDPGLLPGGSAQYVGSLQSEWQMPLICGGQPFDAARVYVGGLTYGSNLMYRGVNVAARVQIGRNVLVAPSLSVNDAVATSLDARFAASASYYHLWTQLPTLPLIRGGITIDALQRSANLEWIVNAQYTSLDNVDNQPANAILNFALVKRTKLGRVTLRISNLGNTGFRYFTVATGTNPFITGAGSIVALPTRPLAPRRFSLTYDLMGGAPPARR
jgi:hypothetical protein